MQARSSSNAQGIDVSHHNTVTSWPAVAADGISFVYIKSSQNSMDPMFLAHVAGARAAGLLVGAYHYLDESVKTEAAARAAAQAQYAAIQQAGGPDVFQLPPALDYEAAAGLTKEQITAIARAFLAEIERLTGRKPILYTGNAFAANFAAELGAYPLWVARYSTQPPADAPAWQRWTFWQYSDGSSGGTRANGKRSVGGISGQVDLNEFNGLAAELRAWTGQEQGDEEDMAKIEELEKRVAELEKIVNVSGNQLPPEWAHEAIVAAKAAGAITTSNDKGRAELVTIQMLYNMGLFTKGANK